jgi:hypothetical protein
VTDPLAQRIRRNADTRAIVGSGRDTEALASLAWAGFLETSQIERLHFPSRRVAQRRLRVLLDHGLVRAHLQGEALQRPNVYSVTAKGMERLAEHSAFPGGPPKRARVPRLQKLRHALAIRETFVAFVLAEKAGAFVLKDFRFDADLTREPLFKAARLIPDGLVELEAEGLAYAVGLEVDLATESTAKTLAPKFSAWARIMKAPFGTGAPERGRLLVAAPTPARVATLERLVEAAGLGPDMGARCVTLAGLPALLASEYPRGPYAQGVRTARTGGVLQVPDTKADPADGATAFRPLGS